MPACGRASTSLGAADALWPGPRPQAELQVPSQSPDSDGSQDSDSEGCSLPVSAGHPEFIEVRVKPRYQAQCRALAAALDLGSRLSSLSQVQDRQARRPLAAGCRLRQTRLPRAPAPARRWRAPAPPDGHGARASRVRPGSGRVGSNLKLPGLTRSAAATVTGPLRPGGGGNCQVAPRRGGSHVHPGRQFRRILPVHAGLFSFKLNVHHFIKLTQTGTSRGATIEAVLPTLTM
jgi:hypothetical protein